jgi:hypothetical protein
MAECVVAMTLDSESGQMRPACNVHCSFLVPCPHSGEPARPSTMHGFAYNPRADTVGFWLSRTLGQRPLVIHCVRWPEDGHNLSDEVPYPGCPCGGEVIAAVDRTDLEGGAL